MPFSPWYALLAWMLVGLATAIVMRRRGHDLLSWSVLGCALGPLAIPLAVDHVRQERPPLDLFASRSAGDGDHVAVLVGFDGSAPAEAGLRAALDTFGPAMRRLTLVRVVDFETADPHGSPASRRRHREAKEQLSERADRVTSEYPDLRTGTRVLAGRPADALLEEAARGGHDVVVVGARGHTPSKAVLGSTTSRLIRRCPIPVFVIGDQVTSASGSGRTPRLLSA